jgi:3-oxoacyl-[acyl-carrier protein] reductase
MRNTHAGKVAIVTGAGRGIGAAIASQLGSESAKVVVNYNTGKAAAEDVVAAILRDGGKALAVRADVGTAAGAERLFTVAEAELGPVDYLVNNAGTILYKPLADVTEEEFDFLFAVNVRGSFLTCKLAARRLREGGSIVNFSSSTTALMLPKYATYVATKGAVEQMSHIFAKEMGLAASASTSSLRGLPTRSSSTREKPKKIGRGWPKWRPSPGWERLQISRGLCPGCCQRMPAG